MHCSLQTEEATNDGQNDYMSVINTSSLCQIYTMFSFHMELSFEYSHHFYHKVHN